MYFKILKNMYKQTEQTENKLKCNFYVQNDLIKLKLCEIEL